MTIIVLAPHPDDEVLGVGGTLAKYHEQGERTIVIIFSTGTASHPFHKEHIITKTRKEETLAAHKVLGVSEAVFLMLEDFNLRESIIDQGIIPKLYDIIKKEKPHKIFMPALEDTHKDHRAVGNAMLQLYSMYQLDCRLYTYTIWNPFSIVKRSQPRLVVDISHVQRKKIDAIREYRSQWVSMYQLVPIITFKTFVSGIRYGYRWAEVFIQIK